jgi:CHAT domain-containing protein
MTIASGGRDSRLRTVLVVAALLAYLAGGCQIGGRSAMPLDEARKVAASFTAVPLMAPPRTILDITAILDQARGEPDRGVRQRADEAPPEGADAGTLATFYFERARAARELGRARQEIEDLSRALQLGQSAFVHVHLILRELALAEAKAGNYSRAVAHIRESIEAIPPSDRGRLFTNYAILAMMHGGVGNADAAQAALTEAEWVYNEAFDWSTERSDWIAIRRANMARARAAVLRARGNEAEAEALYREALAVVAAEPAYAGSTELDLSHLFLARNLTALGRLVEAESEARTAVRGALANSGRDSPHTAWAVYTLMAVLLEQGRYREAEALARAVLEIHERIGTSADSLFLASVRDGLAQALVGQRRDREALAQYEAIQAGLGGDPESLETRFRGQADHAAALLRTGDAERALAMLRVELDRASRRLGEAHPRTAVVRGYLAQAYAATGDTARALGEFRRAAPVMLSRSADADEEGAAPRAADDRLVDFVGAYIGVLADVAGTALEREAGLDAVAEAFRLADIARGRSVQRALDASAARSAARTPALAELVRQEQDARHRIRSLHALLARHLSLPGAQQDPAVVADLRARTDTLRRARHALRARIAREFPAYALLTAPRPATLDDARASLRPGEALIATLVTRERTFVWAVPQRGPVAFASRPIGAERMAQAVATLRRALEPRARTLGDIPVFDVALAHGLYVDLLESVRTGWEAAPSILVVPHGPLAQLPLAVLPTRPVPRSGQAGALFSDYRRVSWLARTHAITVLPSVTSLTTLRAVPPGDPGRRPFIGFGDPFFSSDQARAAATEQHPVPGPAVVAAGATPITVRSSPPALDSVRLAHLPRLPETADEIQALAGAMRADRDRDVFLGARASERAVKTADLARYRVIAFATHGLVPGDLDGLTQPALALSAPEVTGVEGDGLLAMDEILALRLDADWVVLSACNTASGQGAGAEAVSGLGRAFFYAGARSLLVSSWPVETTSARALTTELFRHSAGSSRAEALRAAMTWMIDEAEVVDRESGRTIFAYAHPIFWAPFTLVGDGGGPPAGTP